MKMYRAHLVFLALLLLANPASAVIISFSPSSSTVNVGDIFDVDVVISDLFAADGSREVVSAFDLDVLYDSAVLNATGVAFGPLLGDPAFVEATTFSSLSVGLVDLFELSFLCVDAGVTDPFCDFGPFLSDIQPISFTLATLSFEALAVGSSLLTFDQLVGSGGTDLSGKDLFSVLTLDTIGQSTITVNAVVVPEPATMFLLVIGLLGLALAYRHRSKSVNS